MDSIRTRGASGATARLRRTFRYPSDDELSDGLPEAMDEQEQETLIADLSAQNRLRNEQSRKVLLAMSGLVCIPYLFSLFKPHSSSHMLSLLSLTSIAATAFLLWRLPPTSTGIPALDSYLSSSPSSNRKTRQRDGDGYELQSRSGGYASYPAVPLHHHQQTFLSSPLERYLPYLNAGLCLVTLLAGYVENRIRLGNPGVIASLAGLGSLPTVVYAVALVAKAVMAGVDPEGELGALRYGFKGA